MDGTWAHVATHEFPWSAPWRQRLFSCGRSASVHELLAACGSREIPVRGLRISARFLSDSGGASGSPWGLRSAHGGASGSPWVCEVPPRGHCVASRNFRNFLEDLGSPGPAACRDSSTGLVKVLRGGRNKTAGGRLEIFGKFQVQGKPPARRHGAARGRPCAAHACLDGRPNYLGSGRIKWYANRRAAELSPGAAALSRGAAELKSA